MWKILFQNNFLSHGQAILFCFNFEVLLTKEEQNALINYLSREFLALKLSLLSKNSLKEKWVQKDEAPRKIKLYLYKGKSPIFFFKLCTLTHECRTICYGFRVYHCNPNQSRSSSRQIESPTESSTPLKSSANLIHPNLFSKIDHGIWSYHRTWILKSHSR